MSEAALVWLPWYGWLIAAVFGWFGLAYLLCLKTDNATWADVAWGSSLPLITLLTTWFLRGSLPFNPLTLTLIALPTLMYLRLGAYILWRVLTHPEKEDPRYTRFKEQVKDNVPLGLAWAYGLQATLMLVMMTPWVVYISQNPRLLYIGNTQAWGCIALLLLGFIGETIADGQLTRFKHQQANLSPEQRQAVCDTGLWGFSRHPNYFFQWVFWCGIAGLGFLSPLGWWSVLPPLVMLYFLVYGTGIKPTEALAVERKGDAYRDYQRRVSPFVPWWPKA
jgi:steroid 5-alpha reductase family enzyme